MIKIEFTGATYFEIVEQMKHCIATMLTMDELGQQTAVTAPSAAVSMPIPPQAPAMAPAPPAQQMQPPAYQQPAPAQQPPVYQPQAQPAPAPVATMAPPAAPVAPPQSLPGTAPTYSLEDLMRAASSVIDAGKRPALEAALAQYGVQAMTQLPPEQYGNFAALLRSLGAQL